MGALAKLQIWKTLRKEKIPAYVLTDEHDASTIEYLHRDSIEREVRDVIKSATFGPWAIRGDKYEMPVDFHTGFTWAEACAG
jgi:hypothetical protein